MEIQNILSDIQKNSTQLENIFITLADKFPNLLNRKGGTALEKLQDLLEKLKKENDSSVIQEKSFFDNFGENYTTLFDELNLKLKDLTNLNSQVQIIKEDSEELELITLNAMVVSIKSGAEGRAFSVITENQKQLSNQMYLLSDKLLKEEDELIEKITVLKTIFTDTEGAQKELSELGIRSSSDITTLIRKASAPLDSTAELARTVYPLIQQSMEGLQIQDIIRQSVNHIQIALEAVIPYDHIDMQSDGALDTVCFNTELLNITESVLQDILLSLKKGTGIFNTNWNQVSVALKTIEQNRIQYMNKFLDEKETDSDNIQMRLQTIIGMFSTLIQKFNNYQLSQRDFNYTCQSITERTQKMHKVFEDLKPVIENLQHIRILQQIEVAKNEVLASVRESVTEMDNRINSAQKVLGVVQKALQEFAAGTSQLLSRFTNQIDKDNEQMQELRTEKTAFFNKMNSLQTNLADLVHHFTVLPAGFEQQYADIQMELQKLDQVTQLFTEITEHIRIERCFFEERKKEQLARQHLTEWKIKNDKFKDLIQNFTIAAHKEAAGRIAGFEVEKGSAGGDVILFQ
jgi:hypothetical protein